MNIDNLNKNQVVLLTLLVSFVTSIATGIVTVTLVNQAPPAVTQTINRVVERTIERTVPGETKTQTVIKEVPVIVTEEQLIVDVINNNSATVVRVADDAGNVLGSGFFISDTGLIASAASIFAAGQPDSAKTYTIFLGNGKKLPAQVVKTSVAKGVVLFQVDSKSLATDDTLPFLSLSDADILPGQTVIALGLPDSGPINVSGGIVSGVFENTASSTTYIRTSAANTGNFGGPLLNTKGKVIGLNESTGVALTAQMLKETEAAIVK